MNRIMRQAVGVATFVVLLVLTTGCASLWPREAAQVITMNELPATVRPLAEKEITGCKIIEVEKEIQKGKVVYAITYDQAGTKMEIEYAEDGTLISKGKE